MKPNESSPKTADTTDSWPGSPLSRTKPGTRRFSAS